MTGILVDKSIDGDVIIDAAAISIDGDVIIDAAADALIIAAVSVAAKNFIFGIL